MPTSPRRETPCTVVYVVSSGCIAFVNLCETADRCVHVFISVCVYNKNAFHGSVSFGIYTLCVDLTLIDD